MGSCLTCYMYPIVPKKPFIIITFVESIVTENDRVASEQSGFIPNA